MRQPPFMPFGSKLLIAAMLGALLISAYFGFVIDKLDGVSRSSAFLLIFVVVGVAVGGSLFAISRSKMLLVFPGIYLASIIALALQDNPAKAAHRIVDDVRPG